LKPLLGKILFKLAEIVYNNENGIPLFCFTFEMKAKKDARVL
jgi:hypothetical protein